MKEEPTSEPRENRDPITGERGAHPLGTGFGTTGGAVAGAAIGTAIGGPVGGVAGTGGWRSNRRIWRAQRGRSGQPDRGRAVLTRKSSPTTVLRLGL